MAHILKAEVLSFIFLSSEFRLLAVMRYPSHVITASSSRLSLWDKHPDELRNHSHTLL